MSQVLLDVNFISYGWIWDLQAWVVQGTLLRAFQGPYAQQSGGRARRRNFYGYIHEKRPTARTSAASSLARVSHYQSMKITKNQLYVVSHPSHVSANVTHSLSMDILPPLSSSVFPQHGTNVRPIWLPKWIPGKESVLVQIVTRRRVWFLTRTLPPGRMKESFPRRVEGHWGWGWTMPFSNDRTTNAWICMGMHAWGFAMSVRTVREVREAEGTEEWEMEGKRGGEQAPTHLVDTRRHACE